MRSTGESSSASWRFEASLLRDAADLYRMEKVGVLDKVLADKKCLEKKLESIRATSYWKKFNHFLSGTGRIDIREEDLAIFFHPRVLNERNAARIIEKIRSGLRRLA